MSEIFLQEDIISLLDNRFIVIIGDSIQRGVYKDLVLLLQKNKYLNDSQLRSKGEFTFSGDRLIEGGQYGEMTNGIRYREVRQYQTDFHLVRFYFITRCYNSYVESILSDLSKDPKPDVILMNSCLWDISRYGSTAVDQYKANLETLFTRLKLVLPDSCLYIWNMTLPISKKARGGVLIPQVEYMNSSLRLDILEANFYTHKLALSHGFNTLDLHYYLRHQLQRRAGDGVHWDVTAHRRMTNLILTHIAEAWSVRPPQHARKVLVMENKVNENMKKTKPLLDKNFNFGCRPNNIKNANQGLLPSPQININIANNIVNELSQFVPRPNSPMMNMGRPNSPMMNFGQQMPVQRNLHNLNVRAMDNNMNFNTNMNNVINIEDSVPWRSDQDQMKNIERYGGPIRQVNFQATDMSAMLMGNQMPGTQLNWEPYRNEEFSRGQFFQVQQEQNAGRNQPYSRKVNWR